MKRTVVLVLATAFLLSACIPLPFLGQPTLAPAVDAQATNAAQASTQAAGTLNALPTPTVVPATDTLVPTVTSTTESPTTTATATETMTLEPNITAMQTATLPPAAEIAATATETLHPRFFGTLPPAIPFGKVRLVNRAKAEVYVSLQCTTLDGFKTIIEYPVFGRLKVSAPAGKYNYVAWVGGREFQGSFHLSRGEELLITFNKDKVTIK